MIRLGRAASTTEASGFTPPLSGRGRLVDPARSKARDDANRRFDLETGIAYALRDYAFIKGAPLGRRGSPPWVAEIVREGAAAEKTEAHGAHSLE